MHSLFTQLTLSPKGLMLAGNELAKRAPDGTLEVDGHEAKIQALLIAAYGKPVSKRVMNTFKRVGELLASVQDGDWDNRTPHQPDAVPVLAKAGTIIALLGLGNMEEENLPKLAKTTQALNKGVPAHDLLKAYLRKDDSDDEEDDDDDEDDDSGDGSSNPGSGNGHYNPDEPRIPAGLPGAGQWTSAGNGTSSDSGGISADEVRSAIEDGMDNPSRLPLGTQVASLDVRSDAVNDTSQGAGAATSGSSSLSAPSQLPAGGTQVAGDGGIYNNKEGLLPEQPRGYYTISVIPTPGIEGAGTQRFIYGQGGEIYYTPDHYQTFLRIK